MRSTSQIIALMTCVVFLQMRPAVAVEDDVLAQPAVVTKTANVASADDSPEVKDVRTVIAAIEAEATGDLETRNKLLTAAIELGDLTPARWQAGQISPDGKKWTSIEESVALANDNRLLRKYNHQKAGFQDDVKSNLELAQWCVDAGLMLQARAHLERVIDIEPDHALARNLLGYRRVGYDWISPQEIAKIEKRSELKQASIEKYGNQISKLIHRMNSQRAKTRDLAISEFMNLQAEDAVGAVEAALASEDDAPSKLAIDWMSQIDTVEASHVIARYSLMHPDEQIRTYATKKLLPRPKYDYVPEMLEMLSSPISMNIVPSFNRNGTLAGYRQAFAREDMDGKEFIAVDRGFVRTPVTVALGARVRFAAPVRGGGVADLQRQMNQQVENQIIQQSNEEILQRMQTMEQQNQQIAQVNERVASVISTISEQPLTLDPGTMWEWWDRYNETEYQNYKPERYQSETFTTGTPEMFVSAPTISSECFVAGTPVMTSQGLRPIEKIVTGDLVLSRNIYSGELSWNPVLRPTERPPAATVNISIDDELFCCSTGHLFWVSGKGWRRASELEAGDVLHGAQRPSVVTATSVGLRVETHNLEVADNANYFVGNCMIMTHDVTPRETNRQTVPGQALLQHLAKPAP
jgi:hypothetical protein